MFWDLTSIVLSNDGAVLIKLPLDMCQASSKHCQTEDKVAGSLAILVLCAHTFKQSTTYVQKKSSLSLLKRLLDGVIGKTAS